MRHATMSAAAIHVAHRWEYANQTAREAATGFVSGDVGKLAWQRDDDSFWVLKATTPTWAQIGGGGGATMSNDTPLADGTGDAGISAEASRSDHIHPSGGDSLGDNVAVNGTFDADTDWNGYGAWVISGGVASVTPATWMPIAANVGPLVRGGKYRFTFTVVSVSAGDIAFVSGSTTGTARSAPGTYSEDFICDNADFYLGAATAQFAGSIDNVIIREIIPARKLQHLTPTGASAVFTWLPTTGRKLIIDGIIRSTQATASVDALLKLNEDDTGSHYRYSGAYLYENAGAQHLFTSTGDHVLADDGVPGANALANSFSHIHIEVQFYRSSTIKKMVYIEWGFMQDTTTSYLVHGFARMFWNDTATLYQLALSLSAGNFASGSDLQSYVEY